MRIDSIDLAAAIIANTAHHPTLSNSSPGQLQTFTFPDAPEVLTTITSFTTGDLCLPAKQLLRIRGELYKKIRGKR